MGHGRHNERDDLTGEHKIGDTGQAIIAVAFMIVYFSDTFIFEYTTFLNEIVPWWIRTPMGIIILVISGYLAKTGMKIVFEEKRDTPQVIRMGVFAIMRHPIYFSEILLYFGLLVMSISLVAASIWFIAIIFLYLLSRYEEKLLLARFGSEYERYMKEVPMFLPWIRVNRNKKTG